MHCNVVIFLYSLLTFHALLFSGVIDNVLDSHDGNHDGYLSFHEFKGASKVYSIISE